MNNDDKKEVEKEVERSKEEDNTMKKTKKRSKSLYNMMPFLSIPGALTDVYKKISPFSSSSNSEVVLEPNIVSMSNSLNDAVFQEKTEKNEKIEKIGSNLKKSRSQIRRVSMDNVNENENKNIVSILKKTKRRPKKKCTFNEHVFYIGEVNNANRAILENGKIIMNYMKHCEKLKIKPLDRLIKQIQTANLTENEGVITKIDLHELKIDYKTAEALEEVFRHVKCNWLDLTNAQLDDDSINSICEMLEYYNFCEKLILSNNNKFGMRGWSSISRMISNCRSLVYLDISKTGLSDQVIPLLNRALKMCTTLKILHLENCYLNGQRLKSIVSAVTSNNTLEELYIGDNKITSSDAEVLCELFTVNNNFKLKTLDLRNNSLQDAGINKIYNMFKTGKKKNACAKVNISLEVLHLWSNYLTSASVNSLIGLVDIFSDTLHSVNLGRNKLGDMGIMAMKNLLIRSRNLLRLGFCNNKITNVGAIALSEVIAESSTLLRIDLRDNPIGFAGLVALSQAMQINYSLLKVDFTRNYKLEDIPLALANVDKNMMEKGSNSNTNNTNNKMVDNMTGFEMINKLNDDIKICCIRNRHLSQGGPIEDIMSIISVLSDEHSVTQSLKTLPPSSFAKQGTNTTGVMTSFWQLLTKFKKIRQQNEEKMALAETEEIIENEQQQQQIQVVTNAMNLDEEIPKLLIEQVDKNVFPESITISDVEYLNQINVSFEDQMHKGSGGGKLNSKKRYRSEENIPTSKSVDDTAEASVTTSANSTEQDDEEKFSGHSLENEITMQVSSKTEKASKHGEKWKLIKVRRKKSRTLRK